MDEKGEIKRRIYHLDPYSIQLSIINNIALKFTKNIIRKEERIMTKDILLRFLTCLIKIIIPMAANMPLMTEEGK